jgi:molybdopterin/thiamine biosynthesis adenylyltransferase
MKFRKEEGREWFQWTAEPPSTEAIPLRGFEGSPDRLRNAFVVIAGLGAVGAVAFITLARAGVRRLVGADPDAYGVDSYLTQPCRPQDEGIAKALVQGARAHQANPGVSIETFKGFAQDLPLRLLKEADLILIAGDNLELLAWASWVGNGLGKRIVQGAVFGEQWLAIVRSFDAEGACPACGISEKEWPRMRSRYGCDPATLRAQGLEPTQTLPNICGTAGELLASEALKRLLLDWEDTGETAYCIETHKVWRTSLPRNAECRCPHESWRVVDLADNGEKVTLSMLADGPDGLLVRGELPWISFSLCPGCGKLAPIRRFGRPGSTLEPCSCGEDRTATPVGVRSILPREDLNACLDVPLHDLGVPPGAAVALSRGDEWTYFFTPFQPDPAGAASGEQK